MFIIEKLSLKNLKYFKILQEEANDKYINNKDFFELYNEQSFIAKYMKRREIRLFKYDNKYIGYLWIQYPITEVIKILSLYASEAYINLISKELINMFKNKITSSHPLPFLPSVVFHVSPLGSPIPSPQSPYPSQIIGPSFFDYCILNAESLHE